MEVLTRPWSVGEPASKLQEHVPYSRGKDFLTDVDEVGNTSGYIVAESKYQRKTPNGVDIVESNARDRRSIATLLEVKTKDEEDDYDLVTDDFLSLLRGKRGSSVVASSESGEDTPRALFLQHFEEEEALIESDLVEPDDVHSPEYAKFRMEGMREKVDPVNSSQQDIQESQLDSDNSDILDWGNKDDVELAALLETAEAELQKAMQTLQTRARAKLLEDEETKSLMQEWGLNDKAFAATQPPPSSNSALTMVPLIPGPPLGNGLGPVLHLRDGGSLRSMSPTHFQGGGHLVMQVSSPVVVPSEMGATSVDILRRMAMGGMEGMAAQAMVAMPLEDITGKGVDQISVEHRGAGFSQLSGSRNNGGAALGYGVSNALALRKNSSLSKVGSRSSKGNGGVANTNDEYMNLEDLAPMAMFKIEGLALEGLKIQAEMGDQDAPSVDVPMAEESNSKRVGRRVKELNGVGGKVPLLDDGSHCAQDGNFMSMAVSLDEWMRLDAGVCGENETEEQTLAIIAAHNTTQNSTQKKDISLHGKQKDKHRKDKMNASTGFMGDTITLAMLVQLRDPLRNSEPVGAPMMALVQAERVMVPPKPKLSRRMPSRRTDEEEENNEGAKPIRFKIVGVTVAGLKTSAHNPSASKSEIWGNKKQLQAGSRWLVAQGMQKSMKTHPVLKGKAPPAPLVMVQRGESLWSISARVHGSGAKWRDLAKLNPHIRNPDIIFPDTAIRTH